jgi:hypothetical protein
VRFRELRDRTYVIAINTEEDAVRFEDENIKLRTFNMFQKSEQMFFPESRFGSRNPELLDARMMSGVAQFFECFVRRVKFTEFFWEIATPINQTEKNISGSIRKHSQSRCRRTHL